MANEGRRAGVGPALSAWLGLARLPFHSVGVLPFLLGALLAWRLTGNLNWIVLGWGSLGVVLVMLATYFAGEYWDVEEDALSARLGPSRFAGGSRVVLRGLLPRRAPLRASLASLVLALLVALLLQVGYRTGPWTVPFCLLGLLGGFFYSARPIRWVSRGWGELWIAFCYGWLPVAVGCYLQTSKISPRAHWISLPIGLTILNVILLNEFPDYAADVAAGKGNLLVRLGPERGAILYALIAATSWGTVALSINRGVEARLVWFYLPVLALSLTVALLVLRGRWRDRSVLERLCGANLMVNLGTTAAYLLALAW
jgi:1,4-dihydroxy-2-naphthoate octaprenyltransferase